MKIDLLVNGENYIIKFPNSHDMKNMGKMEYDYMSTAKKCRFCGKWLEEPPAPIAESFTSEVQVNESSNKKTIIGGILLAVVLIIIGGFAYSHISNENAKNAAQAKAENQKKEYLSAAKDFREAASYIHENGKEILEDYAKNWRTAIYDSYAINESGNKQHCSDFNKGVNWRIQYHESTIYSMINKGDELSQLQKKMSKLPTPEGMENVQSYFDQVRAKAKEVVSLCASPEGNYDSFTGRVYSLTSELSEAINKTDVYFE